MNVETRTVKPDEDGMRLDRWFRSHFPALTHGRLEKLLRTGQVRVDGARVKAGVRIAEGQAIRVPPFDVRELMTKPERRPSISASDRAFIEDITIYEDDDLLILNKPSGLAVQGGTKTARHIDGMLEALEPDPDRRPRLVHRLDRDTSGVLVIAKRRAVAAKLGKLFQTRSVRKIYWALVHGVPSPAQGKIDAALVKASGPEGDRVRKAQAGEQKIAQSAVTYYAVIDRAGQTLSLVSLKPVTGRQHQLRAHMAMADHPIVGDAKYAHERETPEGLEDRLHLHARRIAFPHPSGEGTVDVTAPLSPHMQASFDLFGFETERHEDSGA